MTTHPHKPVWQRVETWLIALLVLIALLFIVPHRTGGAEPLLAAAPTGTQLPISPAPRPADQLPFRASDVVHYFSTVLEMSPEYGPGLDVRFENLHASHPEDRWFITIRPEGRGVVVEFRVAGDYGMNLAREFFESPLFEAAESEEFYAMLNEAKNAPSHSFARFSLQMQLRESVDLFTLTLRFAPLLAA